MIADGTIIKGVGGFYHVLNNEQTYVCTAKGSFKKSKILPMVGDKVTFQVDESESNGLILKMQERKNNLLRPSVANVDNVIVVIAAVKPAPNRLMLDKYLLLTETAGIPVIICINKCDLINGRNNEADDIYKVYSETGYRTVKISSVNGKGYNNLQGYLKNKISVVAGASGVGKTSIVNYLTAQNKKTDVLSVKNERGKQTTKHTEMHKIISNDGYIIDTPGFTSLDTTFINEKDLANLFIEFRPFLNKCRFSNCLHDNEIDCEIKLQLGKRINIERYENYLRFLHEK